MSLVPGQTNRGFTTFRFADRNGVECSLQASSIATESCIWLGCNKADPQVMVPGHGWAPVPLPEGTVCCTRMHLTQAQVAELLPALTHFVETGELPS